MGAVTSIGLAMSPRAYSASAEPYQRDRLPSGAWAYFVYTQNTRSRKRVLRTSLRSDIHATDSTWVGCAANNAAASAAAKSGIFHFLSKPKRRSEFAT